MPETIGIQPWQVPVGSDPATVKTDIKRLALAAAAQSNMRFADAAERDTILAPGGLFPPFAGQICWLINPGTYTEYSGTTWVARAGQAVARRSSADVAVAGVWATAAVVGSSVLCAPGRYNLRARAVINTVGDPQTVQLQVVVNGSPVDPAIPFPLSAQQIVSYDDDIYLPTAAAITAAIQVIGATQPVRVGPGSKITLTRTGPGPFGF